MDPIERASIILGKKSSGYVDKNTSATNSTNVTMVTGDAMSDSSDGVVSVNLYGYTISDDDEQHVDIPTTVNVKKGDTVQISMVGADGTAKSMLVTGVIAGGDRMQDQIDSLITGVEEQYGVSTDPNTEPTEWSSTAPDYEEGKYIWTRSVVTNGKGQQFVSDTICVSQSSGGIKSIDVQYYMSDSASELTGGSWMTTSPTWEDGKYIWSKTVTTNSEGTTFESTPICIAGTGIPMTEINAAIDTKIDDIDNGGENLIRNSNTFDFDGYGFVSSYVESGDKPIKTLEGRELSSTISGTYGNGISAVSIPQSLTSVESIYVNDGTDIKQMPVSNFKKAINHVELDEDSDGDLILRIYSEESKGVTA